MEMFNYILPSMFKSWSPNPDSDGQDIVADSSTKKEGVVNGVAVSGVAENEASERRDVEDEIAQREAVEDGASEQRYVEDEIAEREAVEDEIAEREAVEDGASEQRDVEDEIAEREAVEDGASEQRDVEDEIAEREAVEDGASEQRYVEDEIAEREAVEDGASEQRYVEDEIAEREAVEDGASERRDVEDVIAEREAVEDGASEQRYVEDEIAEREAVEDGASEQRDVEDEIEEREAVEDGASEQRDVEDEIAEREDVEDGASEQRYVEDKIAEREDVENTTCEKCTPCKDIADEASIYEEAEKESVHKIGHLICKRVTDKNGTKTRKGQRAWKPIKAVLQGMILYLQKDTRGLSKIDIAIRLHHSLAYSIDYKKRSHVLCLKTADLRLFYFQAENEEAQASWIAAFNMCSESNEKELVADKATECNEAAVEEAMGMDPIHKIGFVICKKVSGENESKIWKSQRAWKPFTAVLQGMILYLKTNTADVAKIVNAISMHHALAYPIDYKKRHHVLCLRTADRRHFFFQAECKEEQASWIVTLNCIAACYSAPPHVPISHDKMAHCPQFLPSFRTHLSLEQQLECYTYQFLMVSKHLAYYNSLPFRERNVSVCYVLQDVKRYETYVRELQKLVGARNAGERCSNWHR